jgi:hypothetical protein
MHNHNPVDISKLKDRVFNLTENELKSSLKEIFINSRKHACGECKGNICIIAIGKKSKKENPSIENMRDIEKFVFVCDKCKHRSWIMNSAIKDSLDLDTYEAFASNGLAILQNSINIRQK